MSTDHVKLTRAAADKVRNLSLEPYRVMPLVGATDSSTWPRNYTIAIRWTEALGW